MSSFLIFWRRMLKDWRFQWRVFNSAADWTVWVYLILPSIVIFFLIYRSWWIEGTPGWIEWVPLSLFFVLGSLYSWTGSFRSFIAEADKVFLIKKEDLFLRLKKWGYGYSIFYHGFLSVIAIAFLLPFMMVHYELTWLHASSFLLYIVGMKYFLMYIKFQLRKIETKTIRVIITLVLFILLCSISFSLAGLWIKESLVLIFISLLFGFLGLFLYFPLVKKNSLFELGLAVEREEKFKMMDMVYQLSLDIEKPKVYSRKKPWLFRNSFLIFKKRTARNAFLELFIKVFVRNSSYILTFFQLNSITTAAIIIVPPVWIKVVIFTGFMFMLSIWIEGNWERIVLSHPFTKKYNEHDAYFSARRIVKVTLFSLSVIFIAAVAGVGLWIVHLFSFFI